MGSTGFDGFVATGRDAVAGLRWVLILAICLGLMTAGCTGGGSGGGASSSGQVNNPTGSDDSDNEDAPLEEGMVFSYHPHRDTIPEVQRPPKIFDGFVITKNGAETLTSDWDFLWRTMK